MHNRRSTLPTGLIKTTLLFSVASKTASLRRAWPYVNELNKLRLWRLCRLKANALCSRDKMKGGKEQQSSEMKTFRSRCVVPGRRLWRKAGKTAPPRDAMFTTLMAVLTRVGRESGGWSPPTPQLSFHCPSDVSKSHCSLEVLASCFCFSLLTPAIYG